MASFLKSFAYAFNGIQIALLQRNIKIQIAFAVFAIVFGFIFNITPTEWIAVLICIALVLSLELVNTAIETLVDLVSPQFNQKAGNIKDIAAGAVLISSIISAIIGLIIFWKYGVALL